MVNLKVIVYIHHDRHTDDIIEVYPYSAENWFLAKEKCRRDLGNFYHGDPGVCLVDDPTYYKFGLDDTGDYESSVHIVDQLFEPNVPKVKA